METEASIYKVVISRRPVCDKNIHIAGMRGISGRAENKLLAIMCENWIPIKATPISNAFEACTIAFYYKQIGCIPFPR